MAYQLIALDVDGTLLSDDYVLTERTRNAVRAVHEQGGRIVLCTGRGPASAIPVLDELGLEGIVITHNGGATVRTPGLELLHQYAFPVAQIAEMIDYCRKHSVHFDVCAPFDMYVESWSEVEQAMYKKFFVTPHLVEDVTALEVSLVKFTLYSADPAVMDAVEKDWSLTGLYGELRMIRSGEHFIDVMHEQATKGNALRRLCAQLQVHPEHVLAIGNYYNDLEMLSFAGLGIAMANSPAGVLEQADDSTASNNEDGVAEALEKHILNG
ncbi:Cof-type HAD-IIB family hydrolase [Paenibacillus lutrae]|uniref:Cof-type HAD-IIB family hydrolase n=1 Tax=Paenibacillus lutrae TaxID=2078573 RepID=A0A7X3FFN7_9BACL|nr:Cof-type HAD-IIB family hydrolase [Paenibacillus lutrae]MVO98546.1 Cof-type HAD-IIB family hydrolase [Paenibacillus lutrae]